MADKQSGLRKRTGDRKEIQVAEDEWCRRDEPKQAVDRHEIRRSLEDDW
jgi:hypothetical protein